MIKIQFGNATQAKKILVVSDLHIGDPRVDPHNLGLLCGTLRLEHPDVLILAGDILEENLASAAEVKRLEVACSGTPQIVVLNGNHDAEATQQLAYAVGATFGECIVGFSGGKAYAIEHGNRFDSWWKKVPGVGRFAIWVNRKIYQLFNFDLQGWLRSFRFVENKLRKQHAKAWAAWEGAHSIVITGHTHLPIGSVLGEGYFNSGDWLYHKTYVVIDKGHARLEYLQ